MNMSGSTPIKPFREYKLNNKRFQEQFLYTNSVAVHFSFLQAVLQLEKNYSLNEEVILPNKTKPINPNHVTAMTLRVAITISRAFNTEGYLSGVSIHRLYQLMCEEYEDVGSKDQFYTEFYKLLDRQLIVKEDDGIITKYCIADHLLENKRFVLFSPAIFTKAFTSMTTSAQKLYFYMLGRIDNRRADIYFTENIQPYSWIYTLTHKYRPHQVKELLNELHNCKPFQDIPLIKAFNVDLEAAMVTANFDNSYVIRYEKKWNYRSVLKAKIPYSKTVSRLRYFLGRMQLGELFNSLKQSEQLEVIRLLKDKGKKYFSYVASRLAELLKMDTRVSMFSIIKQIKSELNIPQFLERIDIMKKYHLTDYLSYEANDDTYVNDMLSLISGDAYTKQLSLSQFESAIESIVSYIPKLKDDYLRWLRLKSPADLYGTDSTNLRMVLAEEYF